MEVGRKKFRIILKNPKIEITENGIVENRDKELFISSSGDMYVERIGDLCFTTKKRIKNFKDSDIDKINGNLDVYCLKNNVSKNSLFLSGHISVFDEIVKTKFYPLNSISVLMKDDTGITTITEDCTIDLLNGRVIIPELLSGNIFSLIYSIKKIRIEKKNKLTIPLIKSGVEVITL